MEVNALDASRLPPGHPDADQAPPSRRWCQGHDGHDHLAVEQAPDGHAVDSRRFGRHHHAGLGRVPRWVRPGHRQGHAHVLLGLNKPVSLNNNAWRSFAARRDGRADPAHQRQPDLYLLAVDVEAPHELCDGVRADGLYQHDAPVPSSRGAFRVSLQGQARDGPPARLLLYVQPPRHLVAALGPERPVGEQLNLQPESGLRVPVD
jgi:hypothetical protein